MLIWKCWPALSTLILGLCWAEPVLAGDPAKPIQQSGGAENRGNEPPAQRSTIENMAMESLLGLSLEDKLGKTEAVSRTDESVLRAPATITTLDSTQIRLSGASTVPDLLRFVPGVAVYRSAPNNYVVALRGTGGLSGNNIVLLVDGIPINSPLDGNVSWDLVPLHVEDIERIEVVRGPVSPTYGANAYTGVINIVTRTSVGLTPSYVARLRGGSDASGNPKGSVSGRFMHIDKTLELKWFLNAERDATSGKPAQTSLAPAHLSPADRLSMTTAISFIPSKTSRLSAEIGQAWSRRSSLEHLVLDSVDQAQRLLFGRMLYELNDAQKPLTNLKVWAQAVSLRIDAERGLNTGLSYDGTRSLRGMAGADLMFGLHESLSALVGGQGSLERMDASYLYPQADDAIRPAYGFYGGIKALPLRSLDVILTGRGDLAPISTKLEYSYRASAVYHGEAWGLRLTAASAFRTPTYVEAVGRFVDRTSRVILLEGSDAIGAPRNTSIELGATFSPHTTITISPTVYLSRLTNLMIEDFESLVRRTFRNDPEPRTYTGGELEANWRISDSMQVFPSFSVLHWLDNSTAVNTNVGVPEQNSRYIGGIRIQGTFGNDRWGYGLGGMIVSPRKYNVRSGIPVAIVSRNIPTSAYLSAMLERQLTRAPTVWASLRLNANVPAGAAESPLPLASPLGHSALLGLEMRTE